VTAHDSHDDINSGDSARDTAAVTMKAFVYRGRGKKALEERPQPEITAARTRSSK